MLFTLMFYLSTIAGILISGNTTYLFDVGNPSSVHVLNDSTYVIVDPLHPEYVVFMMNTKGSLISGIREGRGPGELNRNGFKDVVFLDESIWIWDAGNQRAEIYDFSLNHIHSELYEADQSMLHVFSPLDLNTRIVSPILSRNDFVRLIDAEDQETFHLITNESIPSLARLSSNPLLKQFVISRTNDTAYLGFSSSSAILAINSSGKVINTQEPLLIDFPINETINEFTGPDFSKTKLVTLSITSCEEYVYALQKGEKLDMGFLSGLVTALRGKMIERVEAFEASNKLFVYRTDNLEFVREITLPEKVRYLTISRDEFVALKDTDMGRVLLRFPNELKMN